MGANNGKYPSYPCVDSDLELVFLDAKSEGIPLNHANLEKASKLSKKQFSEVTFYTQDQEKVKRWRNIRGGSIFDFVLNN